jgi:hypothetical protein
MATSVTKAARRKLLLATRNASNPPNIRDTDILETKRATVELRSNLKQKLKIGRVAKLRRKFEEFASSKKKDVVVKEEDSKDVDMADEMSGVMIGCMRRYLKTIMPHINSKNTWCRYIASAYGVNRLTNIVDVYAGVVLESTVGRHYACCVIPDSKGVYDIPNRAINKGEFPRDIAYQMFKMIIPSTKVRIDDVVWRVHSIEKESVRSVVYVYCNVYVDYNILMCFGLHNTCSWCVKDQDKIKLYRNSSVSLSEFGKFVNVAETVGDDGDPLLFFSQKKKRTVIETTNRLQSTISTPPQKGKTSTNPASPGLSKLKLDFTSLGVDDVDHKK